MTAAAIAIVATLDTKAAEAEELARHVRERGWEARLVDVGLRPDVHAPADRDEAMRTMGESAAQTLGRWHAAGELAGAIGIGGNQGTAICGIALRVLPLGVPKLIVSTVVSGDVRRHVGAADIAMLFSVGDLLGGPNWVTSRVLENAAAAICGMAGTVAAHGDAPPPGMVALTAFGNTNGAAVTAMERIRERGWHVVPFHASGACGSAMERLIAAGEIRGVLDLTTHELLAELYPWDIYAPVEPGRLTAAARAGIPQVVCPGGLEYFCFGAPDTIPAELRRRPTHLHNPFNANVRTSSDELARVGAEMAARLNESRAPVAVLIPLRGWSEVGSPGGVLHDPEANAALVEALRNGLREGIELQEVDAAINDREFAVLASELLLGLLGGAGPGAAADTTTGTETRGRYAWR